MIGCSRQILSPQNYPRSKQSCFIRSSRDYYFRAKGQDLIFKYVLLSYELVSSLLQGDYKKLGRVITYLKNTIYLPLIVWSDYSSSIIWNIDASFVVHPDCKSHTGASLTLGHGSALSLSCKQKICTKSLTEAELVGVDDAMTFVMWMKHLFESQVK